METKGRRKTLVREFSVVDAPWARSSPPSRVQQMARRCQQKNESNFGSKFGKRRSCGATLSCCWYRPQLCCVGSYTELGQGQEILALAFWLDESASDEKDETNIRHDYIVAIEKVTQTRTQFRVE